MFLLQNPQYGDMSGFASALLGGIFFVWLAGICWYLLPCALVAHLAAQKGHHTWRWMLFAVFWTPIIAAIFLASAGQRQSRWSVGDVAESTDLAALPARGATRFIT